MSTLAWSFVPLEKVVDFGPVANRVSCRRGVRVVRLLATAGQDWRVHM